MRRSVPAQRRGDEAKHRGPDDAGHGAQGGVAWPDGGIDGDPEGDRGREHHQHGRQATPEVSHVCFKAFGKGGCDHARVSRYEVLIS